MWFLELKTVLLDSIFLLSKLYDQNQQHAWMIG